LLSPKTLAVGDFSSQKGRSSTLGANANKSMQNKIQTISNGNQVPNRFIGNKKCLWQHNYYWSTFVIWMKNV
jgi:hypothetical protein